VTAIFQPHLSVRGLFATAKLLVILSFHFGFRFLEFLHESYNWLYALLLVDVIYPSSKSDF